MRAVWEAQYGDTQVLLQTGARVLRPRPTLLGSLPLEMQDEEVTFMQKTHPMEKGGFLDVVKGLHLKLDSMSKIDAAKMAKCMGMFLYEFRKEMSSMPESNKEMMAVLGALLAAYEVNDLACDEEADPWCVDIWHNMLLPLLAKAGHETPGEAASSSHEGVTRGDSMVNVSHGVMVKPAGASAWRPATASEAQELAYHNAEVARAEEEQRQADEAAFCSHRAAQAQDWDDWAVHSEMEQPGRQRKKVKVEVVVGDSSGRTVVEGTLEGEIAAGDKPMVTLSITESGSTVMNDTAPVVKEAAALSREHEEGSNQTVDVAPDQVGEPCSPVGVDQVLLTGQGKEWFRQWREGIIDDEMVRKRCGRDVEELFHATLAVEREVTDAIKEEGRGDTMTMGAKGDMEARESDEERREREILEGAVEDRPGFVAIECMTRATQQSHGEDEEGAEHIMQEDEKGDNDHEDDAPALMQLTWASTFSAELQQVLTALDAMQKEEAGQKAAFLLSLLRDLRRPSPHLRHPTLVERQNRVEALLSVFATVDDGVLDEARHWCLEVWAKIQPFLEGQVRQGDEEQEALPSHCTQPAAPRPQSVAETIEDSQEFAIENGSRVQVARDEDGEYRALTEEEMIQTQYDEMVEAEAAEMEQEEAERDWRTFAASQYRSWEEWAVAANVDGQASKNARIQVLVQPGGKNSERSL